MPDADQDNNSPDELHREPLVQYEDLEQATGFTQISNAILRCYPELSDGEKMTYAVLKSFAYVGPETFVGEATLARARDITISTISRHLNRLIQVGLVKVRRRGQGKTNIWVITRIPRQKLDQYIRDWRPNLTLGRKAQGKTTRKAQVKNPRDAQGKTSEDSQAEEEYDRESRGEKRTRSNGTHGTSLSTTSNREDTALNERDGGAYTSLRGVVENSQEMQDDLSTIVENVGKLAALAAQYFAVPAEKKSITTFLGQYDAEVAAAALETVVRRMERGEHITKPIAYFYTVVKMMQAERDEDESDREQDEGQRRVIARNWARSLLREWPAEQVRAILADTYRSSEFVDDIMREIAQS